MDGGVSRRKSQMEEEGERREDEIGKSPQGVHEAGTPGAGLFVFLEKDTRRRPKGHRRSDGGGEMGVDSGRVFQIGAWPPPEMSDRLLWDLIFGRGSLMLLFDNKLYEVVLQVRSTISRQPLSITHTTSEWTSSTPPALQRQWIPRPHRPSILHRALPRRQRPCRTPSSPPYSQMPIAT